MEKKNLKLKNNFTQLIGQVSKLYKEVSRENTEAYQIGRKEALEEMLNWFVNSHNGELKYVSANSFLNMVQEKLNKSKTALSIINSNQEDSSSPQEEDIKSTVNFSEIKIPDNRKRINKWAMQEDGMIDDTPQITQNASSNNFPITIGSIINSNQIHTFSNQNNTGMIQTDNFNNCNSQNSSLSNINSYNINSQNNIFNSGNSQSNVFMPHNSKKKKSK